MLALTTQCRCNTPHAPNEISVGTIDYLCHPIGTPSSRIKSFLWQMLQLLYYSDVGNAIHGGFGGSGLVHSRWQALPPLQLAARYLWDQLVCITAFLLLLQNIPQASATVQRMCDLRWFTPDLIGILIAWLSLYYLVSLANPSLARTLSDTSAG
jgi:hypothetical protein